MLTTTPILTMITEVDVWVSRGGQELGLNWAAPCACFVGCHGFSHLCGRGGVFLACYELLLVLCVLPRGEELSCSAASDRSSSGGS